jgi:hypothetical protein
MIKIVALLLLMALLILPSCGSEYIKVGFENKCCKEIRVAVMIYTPGGSYETYGWYTYKPYETVSNLLYNGLYLTTPDDYPIYYYAESTDGTLKWSGDDVKVALKGETLNMRKKVPDVKDGNYYVALTCTETCGTSGLVSSGQGGTTGQVSSGQGETERQPPSGQGNTERQPPGQGETERQPPSGQS